MNNRVNLPPGALIEYHSLCKAIAEAVYPVRDQGLEGVDCIVGKVVKHLVPMAQSTASQGWPSQAGFEPALLSQDGLTLDQLLVSEQPGTREHVALELPFADATHPAVVEFSLPYQLDDSDRRALEAVLPQLPPLRYPMDEDAAAAFLSAYIKLPSRPAWEPVLMTEADVAQQRAQQERHFDKVLQSLRDEFAAGRLVACTQSGLPVKAMSLRCFIPRQSAIAYLDRYGIAYQDEVSDGSPVRPSAPVNIGCATIHESKGSEAVDAADAGEAVQVDSARFELTEHQEEIVATENDKLVGNAPSQEQKQPKAAKRLKPATPEGPKQGAVRQKYTYRQKKAIAAYYQRLKSKPGVRDYTKQTAEEYGLSRRHVTNIVDEIEKAEEAKRAMQTAAGKVVKRR